MCFRADSPSWGRRGSKDLRRQGILDAARHARTRRGRRCRTLLLDPLVEPGPTQRRAQPPTGRTHRSLVRAVVAASAPAWAVSPCADLPATAQVLQAAGDIDTAYVFWQNTSASPVTVDITTVSASPFTTPTAGLGPTLGGAQGSATTYNVTTSGSQSFANGGELSWQAASSNSPNPGYTWTSTFTVPAGAYLYLQAPCGGGVKHTATFS